MTLQNLLLNLQWIFGFRAVLTRKPSLTALGIYGKLNRAIATKFCPICGEEYWVIGNPKIKGKFSPTCSRRQCYLTYHTSHSSN